MNAGGSVGGNGRYGNDTPGPGPRLVPLPAFTLENEHLGLLLGTPSILRGPASVGRIGKSVPPSAGQLLAPSSTAHIACQQTRSFDFKVKCFRFAPPLD